MPVLTFSPRATVWLWFAPQSLVVQSPAAPALTLVLIFTVVFPFLENLILIAQPQVRALPAHLSPLFFNHGQSAYQGGPP